MDEDRDILEISCHELKDYQDSKCLECGIVIQKAYHNDSRMCQPCGSNFHNV